METTRESIHHAVRAMGQLIVVGVSMFSWNIDSRSGIPSHTAEVAEGHTVPMETESGREYRDGCKSTPGVSETVVLALNDERCDARVLFVEYRSSYLCIVSVRVYTMWFEQTFHRNALLYCNTIHAASPKHRLRLRQLGCREDKCGRT